MGTIGTYGIDQCFSNTFDRGPKKNIPNAWPAISGLATVSKLSKLSPNKFLTGGGWMQIEKNVLAGQIDHL